MSDLRIITPKKGYFTFCLREEYLVICQDNHCAAMVLSQHEYWHKNRLDNRQQARSHNEGARRGGMPATQDASLWVYKSHEQMREELLGLFGEKAIGQAYKMLIAWGFLDTRFNPRQKWDRKPQYLFMAENVQAAVDTLPNRLVEMQPEEPAESSPQNCGEVSAELRSPPRAVAESSPPACAVSKESSPENPNKRINQRVAAASPDNSFASLFQEPEKKGPRPEGWHALTEPERTPWREQARRELSVDCARAKVKPPSHRMIEGRAKSLYELGQKGGGG